MTDAYKLLLSCNYSLVIITENNQCLTFGGRGINDIFRLYRESPDILKSSIIADKVIGYGAAVLMVAGGVKAVYTPVVSKDALHLFIESGIPCTADTVVDYIINRTDTGRCPLEEILMPLKDSTPDVKIAEIEKYVTKMSNSESK